MFLPSKKVLSVLVLASASVASVIIASGKDSESAALNFNNNVEAGEKILIPENPDWQKEIEITGLNATSSSLGQDQNAEGYTTTETVSTSLISNYLALKQKGLLNQDTADKLVDQTVGLIDRLGSKAVLNTRLNIIKDNGGSTISSYGEDLGSVFRNNKPDKTRNEIEIMTSAINAKNPSKIAELDDVIAVYQKIADDLLEMEVPQTFVRAHLQMTNGILGIILALKEVKTVFSDPIRGLGSLKLYQEGVVMFVAAKQATDNFILKNNIVYKQGSGGYYLLYGL